MPLSSIHAQVLHRSFSASTGLSADRISGASAFVRDAPPLMLLDRGGGR